MGIFDVTSIGEQEPPAQADNIFSSTTLNPAIESAHARAITSVDANPEQATKSIQIGKDLGIEPHVVDGDFQNFQKVHNAATAARVITNNPHLINYVNADPINPKVSSDDWENLDALTKAVKQYQDTSVIVQAMRDFREGFGEGGLGSWMSGPKTIQEAQKLAEEHPFIAGATPALALFGGLPEATFRVGSGALTAVARFADRRIAEATGQPSTIGDQALRVISDPGTWASIGFGDIFGGLHETLKTNAEMRKGIDALAPYVDTGHPIPTGAHPDIDTLHIEQAKADKEALSEALKAAVKTETRERDPERVAQLIGGINSGEIGIKADAVRALYGDKEPTPDDGVLGWVPNIREQLTAVEDTGGDIQVPVKDWLAKVDPKVAKQLEDHIRARPEGVTVEEGKALPEIIPADTSGAPEVDAVRQASGLTTQERKVQLKEIEEARGAQGDIEQGVFREPSRADVVQGFQDKAEKGDVSHGFMINDLEGKPLAELYVTEEHGGKTLFIDDIRGVEKGGAAGDLGHAATRDVLEQLKEKFPNATELLGYRVSGAREKAGKENVKTKIDLTKVKPRRPVQLELPQVGTTRIEDREPFTGTWRDWIPARLRQKYLDLIDQKAKDDADYLQRKIVEEERKTQTKEWKANRVELRKDVKTNIEALPEVQLDEMLRKKEITLDPTSLTPEQRAALPAEWLSEAGRDPDDLAGHFGASTGSLLVDKLALLSEARKAGNMTPKVFLTRMIERETDRQMEEKYGNLGRNIIEEAKDHVMSEVQENLLYEDVLGMAEKAGLQFSITQPELRAAAKARLGEMPIAWIKSDRYLADTGRATRAMEEAFLKGDFAEAFRQSQRRMEGFMFAKEAKIIEKAKAGFDKIADRFSKRIVKGFPPEYTNAIHEILMKLGEDVARSPEDLDREWKGLGFDNLQKFVESRNTQGLVDGTVIPVPDWLSDPNWTGSTAALKVDDFMEVKQGLDALVKHGRDERKIDVAGEKQDKEEWIGKATEQLSNKFPVQKYQATPSRYNRTKTTIRQYIAAITNMETFFGRLDNRDPRGMFTKTIVYPGAEAANYYATLIRQFAKTFSDLSNLKDPDKLVNPPFMDPATGQPWVRFTRKNLEAVIANIGNEGNLKAMAEGFNIEPNLLMAWIEANTKPEDIARAQARGDAFAEAKKMHDTVERNVNGVAARDVTPLPFQMHGVQYKGWYHPIIDDPIRSQREYMISNAEDQPHSFWPSVATGFTKDRTGAKHVVDLNIDMVPVKFNQILHAIAFKEFVHNTNKIFRDKAFRGAISKFYGHEYLEEMDTWLRDIAGNASHDSRMLSKVTAMSNYMRQNVMSTYIAFNPYTVQKHGLSAWVMSAKEVGPLKFSAITAEVGADFFYHAVRDLFSKDPYLQNTLWNYIRSNSEEIQRRSRNWQETIRGQHDITYGQTSWRNSIAEWGSSAVALSDMVSAAPLWLAKYRESFAELGDKGQATAEANRAVRRAHGSTAITNLPRFVRRAGPLGSWMTSLYGFFGTVMQRRIELAQDINDAYKMGANRDLAGVAKAMPNITTSIFAYLIWPAVVEEIVTSEYTDDKRGLGTKLVTAALGGAASTFLYLREIVYGLVHGREPGAGLAQGPLEDLSKTLRDIEKPHPFNRQNAGKMIQDTLTVFGDFTGRTPKAFGSAARFGHDVVTGVQRPKTFGDYWRGASRGDIKMRIEK